MTFVGDFTISAPIERVWPFMLNLETVSRCLPGAELEGKDADGTYRGSVAVKVGPMRLQLRGKVVFAEIDDAAYRTSLRAEGAEAAGASRVAATFGMALTSLDSRSTRVDLRSDVAVTGRVAQFGRAIMEEVARQIIETFGKNVCACIEQGESGGTPGPSSSTAPLTTQSILLRTLKDGIRDAFGSRQRSDEPDRSS